MLGGEAYKVEPAPVVAGDRVSSARFILLLLLLLFYPCQFNNQLLRSLQFCLDYYFAIAVAGRLDSAHRSSTTTVLLYLLLHVR